jgi:hypothetical protein
VVTLCCFFLCSVHDSHINGMQVEFYNIRLVSWTRQQTSGCDCAIFTALNARLMGQTSQVDEATLHRIATSAP